MYGGGQERGTGNWKKYILDIYKIHYYVKLIYANY